LSDLANCATQRNLTEGGRDLSAARDGRGAGDTASARLVP
jgi:hypothetical protein